MFKRGSIVVAAALLACTAAHATDKSGASKFTSSSSKIVGFKLTAFITKVKEQAKPIIKHHPKPITRC